MAKLISYETREALIQRVLDRSSLPREYAEEMVAISLGENSGDLTPARPLTDEDRRRLSLDLSLEEALARREASASEQGLASTGS